MQGIENFLISYSVRPRFKADRIHGSSATQSNFVGTAENLDDKPPVTFHFRYQRALTFDVFLTFVHNVISISNQRKRRALNIFIIRFLWFACTLVPRLCNAVEAAYCKISFTAQRFWNYFARRYLELCGFVYFNVQCSKPSNSRLRKMHERRKSRMKSKRPIRYQLTVMIK